MLDCCASAAIENVCDNLCADLQEELEGYLTDRFSPGYGDLPITLQRSFLLALNAQRRIGLTVTDSCLLIPSKSVTAIIGVSDAPVERGTRGCAVCNMKDSCAYRASGTKCGKNM